jgi:hypothetical protein
MNINKREITYYDVSPYAALSASAQANPGLIQPFSDIQKLFGYYHVFRKIQTCEHNYTILDGSHAEFEKNENIALWSLSQSSPLSRMLPQNVNLDITFGGLQDSLGITFRFDRGNNVWCDMLRTRWYRGSALLADRTIFPDSPEYIYQEHIEMYDRVVIDFMRLNLPRRFLRVEGILFGIVRVFGDGELENLTVNEGYDPSGRTLFINSADFTINTKDPVPYIFMKRQPLYIKHNGMHLGAYYIDKSRRYAEKRYSVEAIDKIGVLDAADDFMGGIYDNNSATTLEALVKKITGGLFDLKIDESLKNIRIHGWLPIMKRREALAQVAVAAGAMIDTSRSDAIVVRPAPHASGTAETGEIIGRDRVYQSGAIDIEFPCTGIELTEHNFTAGTETRELYRDILSEEKTVKFSEPVSNLTITNGTIVSSGANYAVIRGTGATCTLHGRPYIDNQSSVVIKSEGLLEGTQEKIEKIEDCWLVNKNNSQITAQRLFDYYLRKSVYEGDFIMDGEKIGDSVRIASFYSNGGFIPGQIERLRLYPGIKNIKARGKIRGE